MAIRAKANSNKPTKNRELDIAAHIKSIHIHSDKSRTFRERLLLILNPVLAFSFVFLFWGSMDTVVRNYGVIAISPLDAIIPLSVVFVVGFVLMICICIFMFLRGVALDVFISTLFAITVAGYAQVAFLNRDIGLLDADGFYFSAAQIVFNLFIGL